jgi:hypothetical protein
MRLSLKKKKKKKKRKEKEKVNLAGRKKVRSVM